MAGDFGAQNVQISEQKRGFLEQLGEGQLSSAPFILNFFLPICTTLWEPQQLKFPITCTSLHLIMAIPPSCRRESIVLP